MSGNKPDTDKPVLIVNFSMTSFGQESVPNREESSFHESKAVFTLGPVRLATDVPGLLDPGQAGASCLHVYTKRSSECTMQSIAVFTMCESSVDLCPTAWHGFVTCASMTRDGMVLCPRGPRVNTRARICPVPVPGQCVHINAA